MIYSPKLKMKMPALMLLSILFSLCCLLHDAEGYHRGPHGGSGGTRRCPWRPRPWRPSPWGWGHNGGNNGGYRPDQGPPNDCSYPKKNTLEDYLQSDLIGRDRNLDIYANNPSNSCFRDCGKSKESKTCYYKFNVEQYAVMGSACRNCNETYKEDCRQRQCIEADGIERMAVSINRMIPGPTISVCYGDTIVVDVINKMPTSSLTMHWHGILQKGTPWMDGVPYVTQCPIPPAATFRYEFDAETNGTLFYHAHMAHLHANGVYGALIVRTPEDTQSGLEGRDMFDLPSNTVIIADWNHLPAETYYPGYYRNASAFPERPDVHLINGRGWFNISSSQSTHVEPAEFHVKAKYEFRFRVIAAMTSTCPIQFTVEEHMLKVIALDGYPCKEFQVRTLVMSAGQRTDVVLVANSTVLDRKKVFLMVVKGMGGCNATNPQTAYVIYDNDGERPHHKGENLKNIYDKPPFMNHHNFSCYGEDNVCADTRDASHTASSYDLQEDWVLPDFRLTLSPAFHTYTFEELHGSNSYPPFYIPFGRANGPFAATLSNVSGILPPVPLLTQEDEIPSSIPRCTNARCNGTDTFCHCLNIVNVGLDKVVEVTIDSNTGVHPIHLHGHHFTVVNTGPVPASFTEKSVLRDTVHLPLNNRPTSIQFRADNPGYWILHCHFSPHLDGGMFIIFKVGDSRDYKDNIPKGFPKCGDFAYDN